VDLERTPTGIVIHSDWLYDLRFWLRTLGRERSFRDEIVGLARLEPGESVLDVGCGTGTLALAAKRRVGESGVVHGIDPSSEMIARGRRKADRARLEIKLVEGVGQSLPYDDASFDAVLAVLTLHQVPRETLPVCLGEMARVAKPDGRILLVDIDMGHAANPSRTPHGRHGGHFDLATANHLLGHVGLREIEGGPVRFRLLRFERLRYVLAVKEAD
jgi:ubiquinone/menaquinone biosynthesis C-methylase UbiE